MPAKPTNAQLAWHDTEIGMFVHFGLYVYQNPTAWRKDRDVSGFNPEKLDAAQWVEVAQSIGAKYLVFTAKHGDGFCLWQTDTTDFGLKSTPWKNGEGDIVSELSSECKAVGMKLGIYLSPADASFGINVGGRTENPERLQRYAKVYRRQLTELLENYGDIFEVWFDGSCAIEVGDILQRLAPDAMIFQSPQATLRWVGNEDGFAPYPSWNSVAAEDAHLGMATAAHGNPAGDRWLPLEVDTPIRHRRWMWQENDEESLKSLDELIEIYYRSVGHGSVLLLNSNPDPSGLIPEVDVRRAAELGAEITKRFSNPVGRSRGGEGREHTVRLNTDVAVDHIVVMEDISRGERVRRYVLEGEQNGQWSEIARGSAIGHKKIDFFSPVTISAVRFRCLESAEPPAIKSLAAYSCGIIPSFDRDAVHIHNPFFVGTWGGNVGSAWTILELDLNEVCDEAAQYSVELRPETGSAGIEVGEIDLCFDGELAGGFVTPISGGRWNINISGVEVDRRLRLELRKTGKGSPSGRIFVRKT